MTDPDLSQSRSEKFDRDWTTSPGETLADWIEEQGISVRTTATICGRMPVERMWRILSGDQEILPGDADMLAAGTRIPARLWLNLERTFRADLAAGKTWIRP